MRIVWVLTVLHFVAAGTGGGASSLKAAQLRALASQDAQTERVTIGLYSSKAECKRMRDQLLHAPGFVSGSAQCVKALN